MAHTYTIRLERNDLGQALDGLRCREEHGATRRRLWRDEFHESLTISARWISNGDSRSSSRPIEECRDAHEARGIAEHYQRIIAALEAQMEAQR